MTVEILKHPTEEDWLAVKQRCLDTIGKKAANPPDSEWKSKMLKCRHSPIRYLQFSFYLKDIPYWLHTELVRHHVGVQYYVRSQRDDRCLNDVPRELKPQGALVNLIMDVNCDSLMTIMAKRLCGCATKEMQELMLLIREEVSKTNPELIPFLLPMCLTMNNNCPEFYPCGRKALFFKVGE